MADNIHKITNDTAFIDLLDKNRNKVIVVIYVLGTCSHSKSAKNVAIQLAKEFTNALFLYINLENYIEDKLEYTKDIVNIPTFRFLYNEEKLDEYYGKNIDQLKAKITALTETVEKQKENDEEYHVHKIISKQHKRTNKLDKKTHKHKKHHKHATPQNIKEEETKNSQPESNDESESSDDGDVSSEESDSKFEKKLRQPQTQTNQPNQQIQVFQPPQLQLQQQMQQQLTPQQVQQVMMMKQQYMVALMRQQQMLQMQQQGIAVQNQGTPIQHGMPIQQQGPTNQQMQQMMMQQAHNQQMQQNNQQQGK